MTTFTETITFHTTRILNTEDPKKPALVQFHETEARAKDFVHEYNAYTEGRHPSHAVPGTPSCFTVRGAIQQFRWVIAIAGDHYIRKS